MLLVEALLSWDTLGASMRLEELDMRFRPKVDTEMEADLENRE
jgi:hypothetical protein